MLAKRLATSACLLLLAAHAARADNVGNVTVRGGGTCQAIAGTLPLKVDQIPAAADTIVFRLTLLVAIAGQQQPQYVVVKLTQAAHAATGTAQIFSNGLPGRASPFQNGTWTGKFPTSNAFASIDVGPLTITAGPCTVTLTDGQAIF